MHKISKTTGILFAIIAILSMVTSSFAYLWLQKNAEFTFSVKANGNFSLYEDAECLIPLTTLELGELEANEEANIYYIYVKNEGNIPLELTWDMPIDGWTYVPESSKYKYFNSYDTISCSMVLKQWTPTELIWMPLPYEGTEDTEILNLDNFEVKAIKMIVYVVPTAICEDISFTLQIYGENAEHSP